MSVEPEKPPESPLFDSTLKALRFAFNAGEAYYIASPTMNVMMAEAKVKKPRRVKGKPHPDDFQPEAKARGPRPLAQPGEALQGLNKAGQAGFILQTCLRLDIRHYSILQARFTINSTPCSCGSPCCRGSRTVPRWASAITQLCAILKESGDVLKAPGKRGLSTDPTLRRMIVERFFWQGEGNPPSVAALARIARVSPITAAKHAEWIETYLDQEEMEAGLQVQALFDQTGVTGLIL